MPCAKQLKWPTGHRDSLLRQIRLSGEDWYGHLQTSNATEMIRSADKDSSDGIQGAQHCAVPYPGTQR